MMPHPVSHPTSQPSAQRRRGAFTLVELLVVIGIIAVLVGILLPTLSNARKQASTVKCLANLRELGNAFHLYANFYKDAFPVIRQDTPDDGLPGPNAIPPGPGTGPQNLPPPTGQNRYYTDMLMPFLAKNAKMNFEVGTDRLAFEEARKSVLWGCTEWEGWRQGHPGAPSTYVNGVSIFESGYAMNMWPTYKARYPVASNAKPPVREGQARSTAIGIVGKYHKRSQWTQPSERLLMVDSTLWLLGFGPTVGQILPQSVGRVSQDGQGQTNIDRYRHGKYPAITSIGYARTGGRVSFNVLYVDGHASTLKDIREGYKAIRMRYPGPT